MSALDKLVLKFRREGTEVVVLGLGEASATTTLLRLSEVPVVILR